MYNYNKLPQIDCCLKNGFILCNCLVTVFIPFSGFPQGSKHICFTGASLLFVCFKWGLSTKYFHVQISEILYSSHIIHRLTNRPPWTASVKQILGFVLNADSKSYLDVRIMGSIFKGNSYQFYLKQGYNYRSTYNQIPLQSSAQRPGLVIIYLA